MDLNITIKDIMLIIIVFFFVGSLYYTLILDDKDPAWMKK